MRALLFLALMATAFAGCADTPAETETTQPDVVPEDGMETENVTLEPVTIEVALAGAYPVTIEYSPSALTARAGQEVTIRFTNNDQNPLMSHDWVLEGVDGAATAVIGNGESSEVTFIAPEAGEYLFYCSVPGHRGNGMEGTFSVTA